MSAVKMCASCATENAADGRLCIHCGGVLGAEASAPLLRPQPSPGRSGTRWPAAAALAAAVVLVAAALTFGTFAVRDLASLGIDVGELEAWPRPGAGRLRRAARRSRRRAVRSATVAVRASALL